MFEEVLICPARGNFSTGHSENPPAYGFDSHQPKLFSDSFIKSLDSLYSITDPIMLSKIIPKTINNLESAMQDVRQMLALSGIIIESKFQITTHFPIIQEFYASENNGEVYTMDNLLKDTNLDQFSFLNSKIFEILGKLQNIIRRPITVLYYTSIGFMKLHLPGINIADTYVAVVLSATEAFVPHNAAMPFINRIEIFPQRVTGVSFYTLIDFKQIEGVFYPSVNSEGVANYFTNIHNSVQRIDGLSFPIEELVNKLITSIGLIGRYSLIKRYLTHFKLSVQVVESFPDMLPFIGIYTTRTAYHMVFLYIPNDMSPSHPMYSDVSTFALNFMRKACGRVLCLSDIEPSPVSNSLAVSGLLPKIGTGKPFFFGSGSTAVVMRKDLRMSVGLHGSDSIVLGGIDEFNAWKRWVTRLYQPRIFIKPPTVDGIDISTMHRVMLFKSSPKDVLEYIIKSTSNLPEAEERIRVAALSRSDDLEPAVKAKMDSFTALFNQAARLTEALTFIHRNRCPFCCHPVESVPDPQSFEWSKVCVSCKLQKIRHINDNSNDAPKPTKFLEERVQELSEMKLESSALQKAFRGFFLSSETQSFAMWFFEFYAGTCIQVNFNQYQQLRQIDPKVLDKYKPSMPGFSMQEFVSNLMHKRFREDIEYFLALNELFSLAPMKLNSDAIRFRFEQFYKDVIIPQLCVPLEITPHLFEQRILAEYSRVVNSGVEAPYSLELGPIVVLPNGNIDVSLLWAYKDQGSALSNDLVFNEIVDGPTISNGLASKPVYSRPIFTLHSQPTTLNVVNAFRIHGAVLIVTILGTSLWVNAVPDNYSAPFLPSPLFEMEVDDDSFDQTIASYAPTPRLLIILYTKDKQRILRALKLSQDLSDATTIVWRPLKHLLPVSSLKEEFETTLYGLSISKDGRRGVFCADYKFMDSERQYAVVSFDPSTLMAFGREDKLEAPFCPVYIGETDVYQSDFGSSIIPSGSRSFVCVRGTKPIHEVMGVIRWRGKERIIKAVEGGVPVIAEEGDDNDSKESPIEFTPEEIAKLAGRAVEEYGLGEAQRKSTGFYNIDNVKIEAVFDVSRPQAVNNYFKAASHCAEHSFGSLGGEIHAIAHPRPTGNDNITVLDTQPPKEYLYSKKTAFRLISALLETPIFLVKGPTPFALPPLEDRLAEAIERGYTRRRASMPPLTLLRELSAKETVCSHVSVVSCRGNGSALLSGITGILFSSSPVGSVRAGASVIPDEYNNARKFTHCHAICGTEFAPLENTAAHAAVSLLHALSIGGTVILKVGGGVELLAAVLRKVRESLQVAEEVCGLSFDAAVNFVMVAEADDDVDVLQSALAMFGGTALSEAFSDAQLLSSEAGDVANARAIADIGFVESTAEKICSRIIHAAASYGSVIDNSDLFLIQ